MYNSFYYVWACEYLFTIHKSCQVKKVKQVNCSQITLTKSSQNTKHKEKKHKAFDAEIKKNCDTFLSESDIKKKINDSKKLSVNYSAQIELWLLNSFHTWLINFNFSVIH